MYRKLTAAIPTDLQYRYYDGEIIAIKADGKTQWLNGKRSEGGYGIITDYTKIGTEPNKNNNWVKVI